MLYFSNPQTKPINGHKIKSDTGSFINNILKNNQPLNRITNPIQISVIFILEKNAQQIL